MKKTILSLALASASLLSISAAQAADGTIAINGSITASTCTINGGNPMPPIELGNVSATTLDTAGKVSTGIPFQIAVTGCTLAAGETGVRAKFGGNMAAADGTLSLTGAGTAGVATNVAVELANMDAASTPIVVGDVTTSDSFTVVGAAGAGAATMRYQAYYKALGVAGPGTANTTVDFDLDFI